MFVQTNSIKKFMVDHETCTLCLNCLKSCPNDAIILKDFKVNINKLDQKQSGTLISCLNCGLCSELIENGSLKRIDNKLRYDPTTDISENSFKEHT